MRCGGGGRGHLKEAEDDEEEEEEPPHPSPHVDGEGVDLANELHLRDPLREPGSEVTGSEVTERGERSRNGGGAGGRVSPPPPSRYLSVEKLGVDLEAGRGDRDPEGGAEAGAGGALWVWVCGGGEGLKMVWGGGGAATPLLSPASSPPPHVVPGWWAGPGGWR